MKLKLDAEGHVVVDDGKPVYTDDAGADIAFDVVGTKATIARLNGEAKGHREAKEAAVDALKAFDGISDPQAAIKALETVGNIDAKQLIDAGQIEVVKAEITKVFQGQLDEKDAEIGTLTSTLNGEVIGGSFARSKFIADNMAIPAGLVQAQFGKSFSLENGKIVSKDASGNPIYSKANPGELAGFDEALGWLVGQYPEKDKILKGSGGQGSGAQNGNGSGAPGNKTMTRAEFDGYDQYERAAKFKDGFKVVDTV